MTPEKLKSYIDTRDRRAALVAGYKTAPHAEHFGRLLAGDVVRVGGRASCGGKVDPTWLQFKAWNEIVKKAGTLGYAISVEPVKHGNAWATKAGGFWDENLYRLVNAPATGEQP